MKPNEIANVTVFGGPVRGTSRYVPPGDYTVVLAGLTRTYRGGASGIKAKRIRLSFKYVYADSGEPAITHTISLERIN